MNRLIREKAAVSARTTLPAAPLNGSELDFVGEQQALRMRFLTKEYLFTNFASMARDIHHHLVRLALEKDAWIITHDPYALSIGRIGFEIDLGAERLIAAEKNAEKIAVEIKGFTGPSDVNEFHRAVGQYVDYLVALEMLEPDRMLFLAIPEEVWSGFFQEVVIQKALQRIGARIIVYEIENQTIVKWIK